MRVEHWVEHSPRRLFVKRGVYYYVRRVPKALQARFQRVRVVLCLNTRNESEALNAANRISVQLEMAWNAVRLEAMGFGLTSPPILRVASTIPQKPASPVVRLSDAHEIYVGLKGRGKSKLFYASTDRNLGYVQACLGDADIMALGRLDAAKFRDFLIAKGMTTISIKRVISTVKAAVNLAISENGLDCQNPFSRTFIPEVGEQKVRPPIPVDHIRAVQQECLKMDDNKRHLIGLISDTGMRLSEALGLIRTDIHLDTPIKYIDLQPHAWRPLKTRTSIRQIPLVGASLWAAQRLTEEASGSFLFPSYANRNGCNANSASAALNQWLRRRLPKGCVIHSFRHSIRDRLRAIECDPTIIDEIGGWSRQTVGNGYGSGYPLDIKTKWLNNIAL
jgi:integrase